MGHLVRLEFRCDEPRKLKLLVCSLPFFSEYQPDSHEFYFRGRDNRQRNEPMPDAFIKLDEHGVEFCAYGDNDVVGAVYETLKKRIAVAFGPFEEKL